MLRRQACALHRLLPLLPGLYCGVALATGPGWLYYGGDQGGRHYSDLVQIDRSNVEGLEVAWVFRSGDVGDYLYAFAIPE